LIDRIPIEAHIVRKSIDSGNTYVEIDLAAGSRPLGYR